MPSKKAGKKRPVPAGAEEPVKKGKSIACPVTQKINEHVRTLSPEEVDVIMDDATQQTLRERLHADLAEKDKGNQGIKNTHTHKHFKNHVFVCLFVCLLLSFVFASSVLQVLALSTESTITID